MNKLGTLETRVQREHAYITVCKAQASRLRSAWGLAASPSSSSAQPSPARGPALRSRLATAGV
eukprot:13811055-Alexandrium_andersonii.AAC.1